jgi:hypothetical protein
MSARLLLLYSLVAISFLATFLSGCATTDAKTKVAGYEERMEEALDRFCRIPADTAENRLQRARLVLAAITGHSYRAIQNYSTAAEMRADSAKALITIRTAYAAIQEADSRKDKFLFPVYHADMVLDLAAAAEASLEPSLRGARRALTASPLDRIERTKDVLVGLLQDKLYYDAFGASCGTHFSAVSAEANDRIRMRCVRLADFSGAANPASECSFIK